MDKKLDNPNDYTFAELNLVNCIAGTDDEAQAEKAADDLQSILDKKVEKALFMVESGIAKDWEWLHGTVERMNQKIEEEPKELWDKERLTVFSKYEADVIFHGFKDDSWENRCSYAKSCFDLCKPIIINKGLWSETKR